MNLLVVSKSTNKKRDFISFLKVPTCRIRQELASDRPVEMVFLTLPPRFNLSVSNDSLLSPRKRDASGSNKSEGEHFALFWRSSFHFETWKTNGILTWKTRKNRLSSFPNLFLKPSCYGFRGLFLKENSLCFRCKIFVVATKFKTEQSSDEKQLPSSFFTGWIFFVNNKIELVLMQSNLSFINEYWNVFGLSLEFIIEIAQSTTLDHTFKMFKMVNAIGIKIFQPTSSRSAKSSPIPPQPAEVPPPLSRHRMKGLETSQAMLVRHF